MQAQQTQPSALEPHLSACHAVPMSSLESQVGERRRRCFAVSTPFNEELRKPPPRGRGLLFSSCFLSRCDYALKYYRHFASTNLLPHIPCSFSSYEPPASWSPDTVNRSRITEHRKQNVVGMSFCARRPQMLPCIY